MNNLGFDDFDLDIHTNYADDPSSARFITSTTAINSSTSFCCATATNLTENGCSWCNGCSAPKP